MRLLLLSGIGKPYDPKTGEGVVGKNYSYQTMSIVKGFFEDKIINPFIGAGANGNDHRRLQRRQFRPGPHGFVGGGYIGMIQTNGRPIETTPVPPGTRQWGAEWKKAVADNYLSSIAFFCSGSNYSYRDNYLDLDPTYKDHLGRPLMRMTFDFHPNEVKMSAFLTDRAAEIMQKTNPRQMVNCCSYRGRRDREEWRWPDRRRRWNMQCRHKRRIAW